MSFYPDVKPHISPSALANWHEARSLFVRSYFQGVKTPETASMTAGKQIHALVEGGLLEVKHRYEHNEKTLTVNFPVGDSVVKVLGIPDSYGIGSEHDGINAALFVDYKSGKENHWDGAKLAGDLKMKTTAWLVWNETGKPLFIRGFIEYIPTQWNPVTREVEPTGGESVVAGEVEYTAEEMAAFTQIILKTVAEVNVAYEEFLTSTDDFVSQDDVAEFARLNEEIKKAETKQEELLERIAEQMQFGKKDSYPSVFGTFYFKTNKKYVYPETLPVKVGEKEITLKDADEVAAAASASKKKFETENAPESTTKKLQFRAKSSKEK